MLTTYWKNEVMRTMYVGSGKTFYVGLSSSKPNAFGTNVTEPRGGNYSRIPVVFGSPINGKITNSENATFPTSTSTWFSDNAKATYYVIFDGKTAGAHALGAGALYAPMAVDENVSLTIAAGLLSISLVDEESFAEVSSS